MRKINSILIAVLFVFFATSCGTDTSSTKEVIIPVAENVNESELLLSFMEQSGEFINAKKVPTLIAPEAVYENLDAYHVIDIRSHENYVNGHVNGAVNVKLADLYDYMMYSIPASRYEKIVIVCHSGQTASYATSMLRIIGFGNVYAMKYGMSLWNADYSGKWMTKVSNKYASQLEKKGNPKAKKGEFPVIETGETTGYKIALSQAKKLMSEGFNPVMVKADDLMANKEKYYIVNYWPINQYIIGHIPGSVQYQPKKSLSRSSTLATLPTDKPIVVYCYTGQHAAFVVAYLRMLGYDAYTLANGANSFMSGTMKATIGHVFNMGMVKDFKVTEGELPSVKVVGTATEGTDEKKPTVAPIKKKKKVAEEEGDC